MSLCDKFKRRNATYEKMKKVKKGMGELWDRLSANTTTKGQPDQKTFFWIAASVADIAADNPNSNKTVLDRHISRLFINGKPSVINGFRKLKNPPPWLVIFLVVPFNKVVF